MSNPVEYDPALFVLERAETTAAALGEFILGVSKLGDASASVWAPIPAATFTMSAGYSVAENGTLIVEADTGTVDLSFWDTPGETPLYPSDRVRVRYGDRLVFLGTVDSTAIRYTVDPAALAHGATRRVDFSATVAGTYASMLGRVVPYLDVPGQLWIDKIRQFVTVENWG